MKKIFLGFTAFISVLGLNAQVLLNQFVIYEDCSFEDSCQLIEMNNEEGNLWQIGRSNKEFFGFEAQSNAIMTDSTRVYDTMNHSYFDLHLDPWIGDMLLTFRHKFQTDSLNDGGYIEVSRDNGNTWANVINDPWKDSIMHFATENIYSEENTIKGGIAGFSGTSDWMTTKIQWIYSFPIRDFGSLILRFHFVSDSKQDSLAGWIIDEIVFGDAGFPSGSVSELGKNRVKIVPNPANSVIKFEAFDQSTLFSMIEVFSYDGKKVLQSQYAPEIDVLNWGPGLYTILLKDVDGSSFVSRFVKL
ncbi:MAG: T9SS type A sorting domain-containing protein [Bacteroidetes bacterium]|nr:MAG: T9SS type A sorting domain-containing protein [Bacteroidota bacterium]